MIGRRPKALVSWSSGKDSAWALHEARRAGVCEPAALLTTVTPAYGRISIHGVRESILTAQAERVGLPSFRVPIPETCSNADYEAAFREAIARARADGFERIVFGDLFLEDVRAYREALLAGTGLDPEFPLWGRDTRILAREMLAGGLSARVVCVDARRLSGGFAGRLFDAAFLEDLPVGIDPCGENGEFHTCVLDGPMFSSAIPAVPGVRVTREGFVFADLAFAAAEPCAVPA
jgi:uncharacterized protein (TIGR00290 family)